MPLWMWLNIPPAVLIVAAVVGIPLWMVIKYPDQDPGPRALDGNAPPVVPFRGPRDRRVPAPNGHRYRQAAR